MCMQATDVEVQLVMESFKFLLKRGATVCAAVDGATVLLEAIGRGRIDMVRYLVTNACKLGIDVPRVQDAHGRGALFHAAAVGNAEMFRRLVDAGCQPDAVDRRGRSVLMDAALNGRLDMFKYLVEHSEVLGLDVDAADDDGKNILFYW